MFKPFNNIVIGILLFSVPFILAQNTFALDTQVFKCKTEKGKWAYQSEPCKNTQKQQIIQLDTSKKGHQFVSPKIIKESKNINSKKSDKNSYHYQNIKNQFEAAQEKCDLAKQDMLNTIEQINRQCIDKRNTYCREAEAASIAGNFDHRTWGPKLGWSAYNKMNTIRSRKNRECTSMQYKQNKLESLKKNLSN